ncbi:phage head completion protein [Candidatus Sneabacter namystus]|uniref:Head-tail adaptor protein n=1 Tax=Candidatus Sneabacter namystus TaxID=2601646 RepID=A0A5C0UI23_9RICK|nr:head-tail adaptor protein [Candidatus Sneabacter namystus]
MSISKIPKSLKKKIHIIHLTEHQKESSWTVITTVQAHHEKHTTMLSIMHNINFGNTITNPYHLFQIRYMKNISNTMYIKMDNYLFKIRDISNLNDQNRFLNIIATPAPYNNA